MVNLFGWDIHSRFEAVLERVKACMETETASKACKYPNQKNGQYLQLPYK